MHEEDEKDEATATLESELIDAARELVETHDYTQEDIEGILKGAVFN